jgi:hypothetical protein
MAKKKKKAAKKVVTNEASGAAPAQAASEAELQAAAVVTWGGEGLLGAVEYRDFDISTFVSDFPVTVQQVSASSNTAGERNGQEGWEYARRQFVRRDFADMPFLRVFGRVAEILLNHRRFRTITAGDVFKVFLVEIPGHLEVHHRQSPPTGQQPSVSTGDGRKTFTNRMERLYDEELVRPTVIRASGKKEDYVLTEDGQNMFDGWPDLSEIPRLELDGPVVPEEPGSRGARRTGGTRCSRSRSISG